MFCWRSLILQSFLILSEMEALVFFVFLGIYLIIRALLGGGATSWDKLKSKHRHGMKLLGENDTNGAKVYFKKVLKKRQSDTYAMIGLGTIYLNENEPERALFLAQKALRIDNSVAEIHLLMSKGLYELKDFESALKHAKNATWFGRAFPEAQNWYGCLLIENGDVENGLPYLESSYALDLKKDSQFCKKEYGFPSGKHK